MMNYPLENRGTVEVEEQDKSKRTHIEPPTRDESEAFMEQE